MGTKTIFILLSFFAVPLIHLIFAGELRFCYHGPHRIRYQDCPGGFIAKVPIVPTCTYYHKAEGVPNMKMAIASDVCDHNTYKRMESEPDSPNNPIQMIRFYDIGVNATPGQDSRPDLCNETCLPEWIDMTFYREFLKLFDRKPSYWAIYDEELPKMVHITRWVMIKVTMDELMEEENAIRLEDEALEIETTANIKINSTSWEIMEESHDIRESPLSSILKLLGQAFRITYKQCQPFIDPIFLKKTFRFFIELRKLSEFFLNMDSVSLTRILDILQICETRENLDFELRGHSCPDKDVTRIYNKKKPFEMNFHNHNTSFDLGNKDLFITIGWYAVQIVHGYCFQFFQDDILHFSLMMKALTDFFMDNLIRRYWMYPSYRNLNKVPYTTYFESNWKQLYLLHDNLDACVMGAYENSVFKNRLLTPYWTLAALELNIWNSYPLKDVTPGWVGSVGAYWKKYEKTLFTQMVENLGICYKSKEEFAKSGTALIRRICELDD